jgi:pimeloyl-ACP methyl ester carboxylesterase
MSKRTIRICAVVLLLVAGAGFGWTRLNRAAVGIPNFYVWKFLSGQSHNGHRAAVNGISIYYETYGHGQPVLLLHGATGFLETMHYFISGLAPAHFVIAVDSRAQGRSTDSDSPISYALMGDDMIKLLDTMHISSTDVVGWSDGGIIGLDMAMKHPDRVRRLVAIGANYDVDGIDPEHFHPNENEQPLAGVKQFYERVAPDPSHFPIMFKKVRTMTHTQPHYTLAELSQIRCPTLIVAGQHDLILPEHTAKLAAAIAGAQKIIVPDASHFGPLEQPETYNAMVLKFLNAP